ncbi:xylulokinase [Sulfolobus acidocaldarius]|uniref:Sugar kinase n=4 Tax=Sulfolobus acidocaldarius TaxID=2285 RepID=Q4J9W6_SULAC|nr:FGGY-family carbohydrate kinase [Sulfolobus acidocaldarius]AAY80415.1 sugar kinase [Sulfolobus acidocaldarius DSM 639]AGE70998.1 sugar kinase [Sulfolobus acidocaldarius N8]AGE73269.1 sugar kinase [Sulfolobus acidocaldarius Ron12/I]ALU28704.1 carbohydrate kinase [Sulfolobus acidocaldarius]ALU31422.1 carbohydrate kinase [Sulfolobus acidocaldarius]
MSEDKYVIAFDVGTTSTKCGIISLKDFEVRKLVSTKSIVNYPKKGWAEQDANKLWETIVDLGRTALEDFKFTISGLVFDAHMAGVIPVDASGEPLRNAIIWLDERASGLPEDLWKGVIKLQGYSILKLLKFLRITGGAPSKTGKDVISKIIWIAQNERDIFSKTYKLLDIKGFLISKASGVFVTSHDEASLSWLADTRTARAIWSDEILRDYKIDRNLLPEIKKSTDIAGYVKGEVAKLFGEIPVFVGAGDLTASAVGSGAVKEGEPHIYIGTSDWVASHISKRKVDVFHYVGSILSAIPGKYLYVAEQEVAGGAIEWVMRLLGMERNYEEVEKLVKSIDKTSLLFLPWLYGERSPIDDPTVRGGILNISLESSKAEILRAVMEGVALNIKWVFPLVAKDVKEVNIVGGGALFDSWCQIVADSIGLPVKRVKRPELTGLRGLGAIASVGLGVYNSFEEACSKFEIDKVFMPDSNNSLRLNKKFREFINVYKRLKKTYRSLNSRP